MDKRRILFTGEASFLSTGFATFNREIMKRLYATGKYEIAEMGSYASVANPKCKETPWGFYPVLPSNEQEKEIYDNNPVNQFGKYKIDSVLADFQPDIVVDMRDPWMFEHLVTTRFRDNYKLVLTPTVDSAPQKKEWIEGIFKKADVVTTYSRYGLRVLRDEGCDVRTVTSPGIDLDIFKPLDKTEVRDSFHMKPSLLVFGTVMRNQKRKLYPDLFDAFKKLRTKYVRPQLLKRAKDKSAKKKNLSKEERAALRIEHSALHCHTSYPDLGWDIPHYLSRFQLQRHVVFTYLCDSCGEVYVNWFAPCDKKGVSNCRVCGEHAAHMPNTHNGVDEETLVRVFNNFDIYIQPAICEGWGLPIMESKACGVPGLYQNYSAMEDHVENGGGQAIKVGRFYHEAETSAVRSLPDVDDLVGKMAKLALNEKLRVRMGKDARECAVKMHNWDVTANKFEKIFDDIELSDRKDTWDRQPDLKLITPERPPGGMNDQEFVHWCYINILGRMPDAPGMNDWLGNLANKASREEVEMFFRNLIDANNKFEEMRWENSLRHRDLPPPDVNTADVQRSYVPGVLV